MKKRWLSVTDAMRRIICKLFGHRRIRGSVGTVGVKACTRCRRITDQLTARRQTTRGDIEQRLRAALPADWTLVNINWKSRLIHVTDPNGKRHTKMLPSDV